MARKKRVLIGVDSKWRDLPGHAFLAEMLSRKYGFDVTLVRIYDEVKYWKAFHPDCIVINHLLEDHRREWARKLPKEIKLVILPTEGLSGVISRTASLILGGSRPEYARIDGLLSWTRDMDRFWTPDLKLRKEAVFEVGIPRFDFFYNEVFCRPYVSPEGLRSKLRIPSGARIITFFLNFQYATVTKDLAKWESILRVQGLDPAPFLAMARRDVEARDGFCEILRECYGKYPDTYFIVKPHPNEDFGFYRRRLRSFRGEKRIKVVPDAYSLEVLKISGLSVQRICTTGLEAAILGRPAIDFDYGVKGAYEGDVLKGIWPEAGSKEQLFHLFDKWRTENNAPWDATAERRRLVIAEWASLNEGKATEKAAEVIASLCESAHGYRLNPVERADHMVRYYIISFLKDVYRKIFPDRWGRYNKAPNFYDFASWRRRFNGLV